jgi:hypothetical protein
MTEALSQIGVAEKGGNEYDVIGRPVSKRRRKNRTWIIVGIVVLFCLIGAGVGLGIHFWKKSDGDSSNTVMNQNTGAHTSTTPVRTLALIDDIRQLRAPLSGSVDLETARAHAQFTNELWDFEQDFFGIAEKLARDVFHVDMQPVHEQFELHTKEINELAEEVLSSIEALEEEILESPSVFHGLFEVCEKVGSVGEPKSDEAHVQNVASAPLSTHALQRLNLYRSKVEQVRSVYDVESLQRLLQTVASLLVLDLNDEFLNLFKSEAKTVVDRSWLKSALLAIQDVEEIEIEVHETVAKAIETLTEALPGVDMSLPSLYLDHVDTFTALHDAKSLFLVYDTVYLMKRRANNEGEGMSVMRDSLRSILEIESGPMVKIVETYHHTYDRETISRDARVITAFETIKSKADINLERATSRPNAVELVEGYASISTDASRDILAVSFEIISKGVTFIESSSAREHFEVILKNPDSSMESMQLAADDVYKCATEAIESMDTRNYPNPTMLLQRMKQLDESFNDTV